MTTGVYKIPYKGEAQELANYVLDHIGELEWHDHVNQSTYNKGEEFSQTHYAIIDLPQKYKDIIEDSMDCNIVGNTFVWSYGDAVENSIHKDNTAYTEGVGGGYWNIIMPIIDAGTRIDMWEPLTDIDLKYASSKHAKPLSQMNHDHFRKTGELKYEMGDIVFLANQHYYHSVDSETTDKMSLHFYADKPYG